MTSKTVYRDSPFGIAVFPHLNEPDAKFNPNAPVFKTGLRLTGEVAQKFKAQVDEAAQAAYDAYFAEGADGAKLSPKKREEFSVFRPYEEEEDGEGNLTGAIVFEFRQNASIKLRDGTVKKIVIGIYDAAGTEMHKLVRGGSEVRINYSMRPIPMASLKKVGVRLDFSRVQVKTLATGNSGGGFGAVDGYVDDGDATETKGTPFSPAAGADY